MRGSCSSWAVIPGTRSRAAGERDIRGQLLIRPAFFRAAFDMMDGQNALSDFIIDSLSGEGGADEYLHFAVADVLPVQNLWWKTSSGPSKQGESGSEKLNEMTMGIPLPPAHAGPRSGQDRRRRAAPAGGSGGAELYRSPLYRRYLREFAARNGLAEYTVSRMIKGELGTSFRILLMEKRFSAVVISSTPPTSPSARSSRRWVTAIPATFIGPFSEARLHPQEYRRRRKRYN